MASEFAAYGDALESAPDRILTMAETALRHGNEIEKLALSAEIADAKAERMERRIGQFLVFGVCMTALIAGALTGGWYGAIIGAMGGIALVGNVIVLLRKKKAEDSES